MHWPYGEAVCVIAAVYTVCVWGTFECIGLMEKRFV